MITFISKALCALFTSSTSQPVSTPANFASADPSRRSVRTLAAVSFALFMTMLLAPPSLHANGVPLNAQLTSIQGTVASGTLSHSTTFTVTIQ